MPDTAIDLLCASVSAVVQDYFLLGYIIIGVLFVGYKFSSTDINFHTAGLLLQG